MIKIEPTEEGQSLVVEHAPTPGMPGQSPDPLLRRVRVEPITPSGYEETGLLIQLWANEPHKTRNPLIGMLLTRDEAVAVRDAIEAYLDPGAVEREFEQLRAHLARMDQVDGK